MRNTIKTLVLAAVLATGGAELALAQAAVTIDGITTAPDGVRNPDAHLLYGIPNGYTGYTGGSRAGYAGGARTRAMLGQFGQPQAASAPVDVQGGLQSEYEY